MAYDMVKRIIDIIGSAAGLVALAPLFAVLGLLVKLDSPGPVCHRRRILQRGGNETDAYKFRTMIPHDEGFWQKHPDLWQEYQASFKLVNDPRLTRLGSVLRTTSLDELPQLLNVLKGEMSLVGPRMISPQELGKYGPLAHKLLSVKPGMTGLWQVSGRQHVSYEDRVALDMAYIDRRSLALDLKILLRTVLIVIRRKGAY